MANRISTTKRRILKIKGLLEYFKRTAIVGTDYYGTWLKIIKQHQFAHIFSQKLSDATYYSYLAGVLGPLKLLSATYPGPLTYYSENMATSLVFWAKFASIFCQDFLKDI